MLCSHWLSGDSMNQLDSLSQDWTLEWSDRKIEKIYIYPIYPHSRELIKPSLVPNVWILLLESLELFAEHTSEVFLWSCESLHIFLSPFLIFKFSRAGLYCCNYRYLADTQELAPLLNCVIFLKTLNTFTSI